MYLVIHLELIYLFQPDSLSLIPPTQALLPFLLEPTAAEPPATTTQRQLRERDRRRDAEIIATEAFGGGWGRSEKIPGLSGPLDSLRFQVMLSSMGRVLADSGLIDDDDNGVVVQPHDTLETANNNNNNDNNDNNDECRQQSVVDGYATGSCVGRAADGSGIRTVQAQGREDGSLVGAPSPLVSAVLSLVLLLRPSDMAGALLNTVADNIIYTWYLVPNFTFCVRQNRAFLHQIETK